VDSKAGTEKRRGDGLVMVGGAVAHPAVTPEPELGNEYSGRALCEKTARRDMCGGGRVTGHPTAMCCSLRSRPPNQRMEPISQRPPAGGSSAAPLAGRNQEDYS